MPTSPAPATPRTAARAAGLLALALAAGTAAAACRPARDAAADERERQEREVERLAEQAGRMAGGDSGARASRDSGMRVSLGNTPGAGIARGDDPPLGDGDVRVTSTDGLLVLALIGDTVRTRLGDSALAKTRREMDAAGDTATGLGGFVARTVKGAVSGAMGEMARFTLRLPVQQVRDLRYEDGKLHFRTGKDGNTSASFAQADAERFIAAVRARQDRPAGR